MGSSGRANDLFSDLSIPLCIDHMERYFGSLNTTVPPGLVADFHAIVENFTCSPPRRSTGRVW